MNPNMISRYIIYFLILALACLFTWPVLVSNTYKNSQEQEFNTPKHDILKYSLDIQNIPSRLPKISHVQLIDSTATIQKFKIITHNGAWLNVISEVTSDSTRTLEILSTSFGYSGIWKYLFRDLGNDQSKIIIQEKSKLDNYWLELLLLIGGRDILVQEELRGIQWMAKEDQ